MKIRKHLDSANDEVVVVKIVAGGDQKLGLNFDFDAHSDSHSESSSVSAFHFVSQRSYDCALLWQLSTMLTDLPAF
jgi:hypothetical protein